MTSCNSTTLCPQAGSARSPNGSHYKASQESGAGFIIYESGALCHCSSHHLGAGTNNTAELYAVIYALRHVIELVRKRNPSASLLPAYLFSDSKCVLDLVEGKSKPRVNIRLVRTLMELVAQANTLTKVRYFKVPGHAKILENEIVDFIAKRGANGVTSTQPPPQHVLCKLRAETSQLDNIQTSLVRQRQPIPGIPSQPKPKKPKLQPKVPKLKPKAKRRKSYASANDHNNRKKLRTTSPITAAHT
jgi:ribonuclease HI